MSKIRDFEPQNFGIFQHRAKSDFIRACFRPSGVWTGKEFIIWGGFDGSLLGDGARYDPILDRWRPVHTDGAPAGRHTRAYVWTGIEMIVWSGTTGTTDGARYNPERDSWSPMTE